MRLILKVETNTELSYTEEYRNTSMRILSTSILDSQRQDFEFYGSAKLCECTVYNESNN